MPALTCVRCRQLLTPVYPGQREHPMCSPTNTSWIPRHNHQQDQLPEHPARHDSSGSPPAGLAVALRLAAAGWHILPLAPATKKPLANCPRCASQTGKPPCDPQDCPCIPAGRWCHGVRAATTSPHRLTNWWNREPAAVPGTAAGPTGLVLVDIDAHDDDLPADLAVGLLPGINLAAEATAPAGWDNPASYRDGRDSLRLLAAVRGGPYPWPPGARHQPVTVATPSGGRHLWYQAPAPGLRQALADPKGRHGLAWQVDIKAGWSYGLAPEATTRLGTYRILSGDPAAPGVMPEWFAREVVRACKPAPRHAPPAALLPALTSDRRGAAYLNAVLDRGAAQLAAMRDGRKRALAALAYQAGGLLTWSGVPEVEVTDRLTCIGATSGLPIATARRIVTRALANGVTQPLTRPPATGDSGRVA